MPLNPHPYPNTTTVNNGEIFPLLHFYQIYFLKYLDLGLPALLGQGFTRL